MNEHLKVFTLNNLDSIFKFKKPFQSNRTVHFILYSILLQKKLELSGEFTLLERNKTILKYIEEDGEEGGRFWGNE